MAKRPILTTSESGLDREHLAQLFKSRAERSLAQAIDQLNARSLYARALNKIEQGQDLSDELPELKEMSKPNAIRVIKNLIQHADEQVEGAWAIDPRYAELFKASFRVKHPDGELFPVFDVEYTAVTEEGNVVFAIVTNRRTVEVTVTGTDAACANLARQLVIAGLR